MTPVGLKVGTRDPTGVLLRRGGSTPRPRKAALPSTQRFNWKRLEKDNRAPLGNCWNTGMLLDGDLRSICGVKR